MSNSTRRAKEEQPATPITETVMTVLKPEASQDETQQTKTEESIPEPVTPVKPVLSVIDIKRRAQELHFLSEQHDNLLEQLTKVQQFAAEVGENATLRLSSDGVHSFQSKDPAAVQTMINICVANIQGKILEIENRLTA